ncbi:hypothetical protein [Novosphingobium mangrovi (ex Hu et al. 2023)]|uniref:Uncharacterized protein n=1 Tax=Novosphingobium mangrovi (ex Hu et al. 2023) TaxID=2930094 RepID=A0ABT0AAD3_9SPHN|nr:hypothetical protein [Novosphingobium mangrovi (ex Hu et al. 2023)]MCJ1960160.1 hypothetical protein [Novosphingobium mangrovi (ex Hu et al. 2023)]
MNDQAAFRDGARQLESMMGEELARGDASAQTMLPILRHLISAQDNSVFSDEILARVRGMVGDLAGQLMAALTSCRSDPDALADYGSQTALLGQALIDNPQLLTHLHGLALEWQLTERLQARHALDPVVPPLLQALISSNDPETQDTAMRFLAAQARWGQAQRRMRLPLTELPGELLHAALMTLVQLDGENPRWIADCERAAAEVRARFDEGASRIGLAAQLILALGGGAQAALSICSAGLALFLSALALASGQERDHVIFSTHEGQMARLALSLRAAGLKTGAIEQEFLALHPDVLLPEGFGSIGADRAAAILNSVAGRTDAF